ncbi:hypothetical protein AVEN_68139-1 [Araneus ventricosus]|uniref:Uncharacterized protein n=1 Tax=Araneus ventricosus TaxID=182803 RepID=A0A4Y2RQU9_ARAVE|nr:hypothetical protein AVEN_68139-1 [Araneus ventricosus]
MRKLGGRDASSSDRSSKLRGSTPDPTEDPPCMGPVESYVVAKHSHAGEVWKFGEGVPVQVSSSSSDRGSKLRV